MARADLDNENVEPVEKDDGFLWTTAGLLKAFDADMLAQRRGEVEFDEGDQVYFEKGVVDVRCRGG